MTKNLILSKQQIIVIKDLILKTVNTQKPHTNQELIKITQQDTGLSDQEITNLIIELENENKLKLNKTQPPLLSTAKEFVFSKQAIWFWTTIAIGFATAFSVFAIPENSPIIFLRSSLGIVFVLFLPGYAFIKMLFPQRPPIPTNNNNIDNIERIALSLGMSIALSPIVGLILNYTPLGIRLTPITLSLLGLTVAFATTAILREYQTKITNHPT